MNEFMEILDKIEQFDLESQSVLVDIINKRYAQHRRESFIQETIESINELNSGESSSGTSKELFKELNI